MELFVNHWTEPLIEKLSRKDAFLVNNILYFIPSSPRAGVRVLIEKLRELKKGLAFDSVFGDTALPDSSVIGPEGQPLRSPTSGESSFDLPKDFALSPPDVLLGQNDLVSKTSRSFRKLAERPRLVSAPRMERET